MQVKDIMTRDVESVTPKATIRELARKMRDGDVGILPIVEKEKLLGVVTDRDLVLRGLASDEADLDKLTADTLMTDDVHRCREDQSLEDLRATLESAAIRRIAVVDSDDRLVGMVSLGDLAKVESSDAGEALKAISKAA
ncbi:MAG: CBS domain-containing protein [Woeseiaceae bacterium]|nr:CBS domain-containing protein [Woeseiaceae bacterium]